MVMEGSFPVGGPCAAWEPLCADFPEDPTPIEQDWIESALQSATEVLWNRTKRRFGLCEVTYRPCKESCWGGLTWPQLVRGGWFDASGWGWPFPALVGGKWLNLACGNCSGMCSCGSVEEVRLPYPVYAVTEVKTDGEILPASAYQMYNRNRLLRVDGGRWLTCNDLELDDTEPGTWSVTAQYGEPVPELGRMAVGELASQIYRRCSGDGAGCQLPAGVVKEITRQGVKKVFFDAETAFQGGRVGLYSTDLFISTYNPSATGMASIFNIDGPRRQYQS